MNQRDPLNPELEKYLAKILEKIQVDAISVIDREGVVLGRAFSKEMGNNRNTAFTSVLATAADQASKCGMGNCKSLVSFYNDHVLVCVNYPPVIITFVGALDCNVGLILDMQDELRTALEPLHSVVLQIEEQQHLQY